MSSNLKIKDWFENKNNLSLVAEGKTKKIWRSSLNDQNDFEKVFL